MYEARKKLWEIDLDEIFGGGVDQLFINENLTTKRRKHLGKVAFQTNQPRSNFVKYTQQRYQNIDNYKLLINY